MQNLLFTRALNEFKTNQNFFLLRKLVLFAINAAVLIVFQSIQIGALAQTQKVTCGGGQCYEQKLQSAPDAIEKMEAHEEYIRQRTEQLKTHRSMMPVEDEVLGLNYFIIPVVFHIIHEPTDLLGTGSNIPYSQIVSQMQVLNEQFYDVMIGVEPTHIKFCLAGNAIDGTEPWVAGEQGVLRYPSALTHHEQTVSAENALMNLTHNPDLFPFDNYLNIWIVNNIGPDGINEILAGYAPQPLLGNSESASGLDGVVLRHDVIGSYEDGTFELLANSNEGKTLVHEIGHYFNLMHTFQGPCTGMVHDSSLDDCETNGDRVCDTPPQNGEAFIYCDQSGNITEHNSCEENYDWTDLAADQTHTFLEPYNGSTTDYNDLIACHMNYTHDRCKHTFTMGQVMRMHAHIAIARSQLSSAENLALTGITSGGCVSALLNAAIFINGSSAGSSCVNESVQFSSNFGPGFSATSWTWDFDDGTTASGYNVAHSFTSVGVYEVSLTVSDGTTSLTNSYNYFVSNCSIENLSIANVVFERFASFKFNPSLEATDISYSSPADGTSTMVSSEGCIYVNDPFTGELLFYSDGYSVWDKDGDLWNLNGDFLLPYHYPITTNCGPGYEGSYQSSRILDIAPFPGHFGEYFVFIPTQAEVLTNDEGEWPFVETQAINVVHVSVDDEVAYLYGVFSPSATLPNGSINPLMVDCGYANSAEYVAVSPHCNNKDYWIHLQTQGNYSCPNTLFTKKYLLTELGFSDATMQFNAWSGTLKPTTSNSSPFSHSSDWSLFNTGGVIKEYNGLTGEAGATVSTGTGAPSNYYFACFSPENEYLYLADQTTGVLRRQNVLTGSIEVIAGASGMKIRDLILGPEPSGEQLIYGIRYNPIGNILSVVGILEPNSTNPNVVELDNWQDIATCIGQGQGILPRFPYIPEADPIALELTYTYNTCYTSTFEIPGCFANHNIVWNFGDGNTIEGGLSQTHTYGAGGLYHVTVTTDRSGWLIEQATFDLYIPTTPVASVDVNPVCVGQTNEVSVNDNAGYTSYDWTINEGGLFNNGTLESDGTILPITWLEAGIWTVTLTATPDNTDCPIGTVILTVTVNSPPVASMTLNGTTLTATATSGTAPYTYEWFNQQGVSIGTGDTYSPASNQIYQLEVTDALGCTDLATIDLLNGDPCEDFSSSISSQTNITCNGLSNGSATAIASGGTAPYTYAWSNGDTDATAEALAAGTYTCTVTDDNDCVANVNIEIVEPSPLISVLSVYYSPNCDGLTGNIGMAILNSSEEFTFTSDPVLAWTNNLPNSGQVPTAAAGTYTVTATSSSGCTVMEYAEVVPPAALSVFLTSENQSCSSIPDGEICAEVSGGSDSFSYVWYINNASSQCIAGQPEGQYGVYISDNLTGCVTEAFGSIESAPSLSIEINTAAPVCPDECSGQAFITPTGGTGAITIYPTNLDPYALCAGTYNIMVEDEAGCTADATFTIDEVSCCPLPGVDNTITYSTDCELLPGATIQFFNNTTTPGATFFWSLGQFQYSIEQNPIAAYSAPGIYNVLLIIYTPGCPEQLVQSQITIEPFDNTSAITITSDAQTNGWNNNTQSFSQDITFGNGSSVIVTVHDAVFILGPGVDIIISENASVTFDRCTFTSCGTWEGFNVRSNSLTTATSGILRMDVTNIQNASNFSVIENARIGIEVFDERTNANLTAIDLLQGGRVYCGRTRFVNCRQAFNLRNAADKGSYFKLCQFNVNDEIAQHFPDINLLPGYNEMTSQCRHDRSIGYNYYGCSWTNSMTSGMDNWTNRGIGVHTTASTFTLTRFTTNNNLNPVQGTTQGFDIGLQQSSKGGRVTLSYQNFQQNHIGAYFHGGLSHRAFKNNFVIGRNTNVQNLDEDEEYGTFPGNSGNLNVGMTTSYEGLVLRNTDLMEIAENTFTGVLQTDELDNDGDNNDGVGSDYPRLGIRIRATNTDDMVVRKNTLSKLNYANLANADNAGGTGTSGLRYICNVNSNNLQDFTNTDFVGSPGSATIGMVQQEPATSYPEQQGTIIWPTGNILSEDLDENEDTYIHFRNEGVELDYWHSVNTNEIPTDKININNYTPSDNSVHLCPAKYISPILIPHTPNAISGLVGSGLISKADADQYQYVYLLLLDGGNTAALEQYVDDTWGAQVWATRQHLLNLSPYLTESVMLNVLDNTQVYPHAIAFEILLANPDLLNDPKMVDYLSLKTDPMPQYLIELLLAYNVGTSNRGEMEKELAVKRTGHITKVSEALWAMMDYYEDDTYSEEDFEQVIGGIGSLNAEMALVEMLLDKGDVNSATIRAEDIPKVVHFGKGEGDEYDAFMDWITLRKDMMSAGRQWSTMNGSDISALEDLLSNVDTYAASQAIAVLNEHTSSYYFIPPAYGQSGIQKRENISKTEMSARWVQVYPNPANFLVTIELKNDLPSTETFTLCVSDIMGRIVFMQEINTQVKQYNLNTQHWANGLYTFSFYSPRSSIEFNGKIDVQH